MSLFNLYESFLLINATPELPTNTLHGFMHWLPVHPNGRMHFPTAPVPRRVCDSPPGPAHSRTDRNPGQPSVPTAPTVVFRASRSWRADFQVPADTCRTALPSRHSLAFSSYRGSLTQTSRLLIVFPPPRFLTDSHHGLPSRCSLQRTRAQRPCRRAQAGW